MFSALNQGSLIYILDRTDGLAFKIGEVTGVTVPQFASDGSGMVVNLKVKIDNIDIDYNNIPSAANKISYNQGKLIISETKDIIQAEIESILHRDKHIIEHIDDYYSEIKECEHILKDINPQYAKDKDRDDKINALELKVNDVDGKLAKILDILSTTKN